MKKSSTTLAVLATVAAATIPVAASAAPLTAGRPAATIDNCAAHAQVKPTSIILFCGDANQSLSKLHWTDWGRATATATALQITNTCTPDCAAGHDVSKRVKVTVSGLRAGRYTKLIEAGRHFNLTSRGAVIA